MSGKKKNKLVPALVIFGVMLMIIYCGGALRSCVIMSQRSLSSLPLAAAYPKAPAMPARVNQPMIQLLSQYEMFLKDKAPKVYADLQPGLTSEAIDTLEKAHDITLPADLRALYQWRNGVSNESNLDAFPNHRFIPLDEALASRDRLREDVKNLPAFQKQAYETFAGHRRNWIEVIVDPAGDGYFFDPDRSESEGSFFFNFNETGEYLFYPSIRNYLAQVVQACDQGICEAQEMGIEIVDYEKFQVLEDQFGSRNSN